jgi:hypothetical protein
MDGNQYPFFRNCSSRLLSAISLAGALLGYCLCSESRANLPGQEPQELVGETVKFPPWVPKLADCVEISIDTPKGWRLSIYPNGDFYLRYGSGNVPEVAPFGGNRQGPLDFATIYRHLAVATERGGNSRELYAVGFHRRNADSTSCVYTADQAFIVRVFDKAKAARPEKAGDASWEKLWADHPRTLLRREGKR